MFPDILKIILLVYLLFINLTGFFLMHMDKQRAIKKKWRIRERTMFLAALAGGSLGILAGMYLFHHKTRHWYFVLLIPFILVLQIALIVWISFRFS